MARKPYIFEYLKDENPEGWGARFAARAQPTTAEKWAWCPGSFMPKSGKACGICGVPVKIVRERWIRPHITGMTGPGVYLVDVGGSLKIGMSQNAIGMARRLESHLQNTNHQRCVVRYLFLPPLTNQALTWQVPQILESMLQAHLIASGAKCSGSKGDGSFGYEYFACSTDPGALIQKCITYLNRPGLVEQIEGSIS
jgi:hypothetical protein